MTENNKNIQEPIKAYLSLPSFLTIVTSSVEVFKKETIGYLVGIKGENKFMEGYRNMYPYIHSTSHNGPLTLLDGTITDEDAELAARIAARFGQGRDADEVEMSVNYLDGKNTIIKVKPMPKDEILEAWYV